LPYGQRTKHIGHLAGAYIPADVVCRFLRLNGKDIVFVSGSDEHGTAIPNQALKEQTTSKAIIDKYHALIAIAFTAWAFLLIFITAPARPIHHQTSQEFFLNLYQKKLLNEETSEQYYDEEAKLFLADRIYRRTCPKCGTPQRHGDQCEKCGSSLSSA